jgi:uncharacterized protein YfdQ (DUF2303 family)
LMEQQDKTAEIIRDLTAVAAKVNMESFSTAGGAVIVKNSGGAGTFVHQVLELEKYLAVPLRNREKVEFQDVDSFTSYLNDFKNPGSRIFFDNDTAQFAAIVDYPLPDGPAWGEHVAALNLRHSEEWNLWFGRNSKWYGQIGFGRFIEENLIDVVSPDGAKLLEMVMTFEANKSVSFREANRLKDGTVQFSYVEELKTGTVEIPDKISIRIPIFYNQEPQLIELRFRYKIEDQKLQLCHEFVRAERIKNDAAARIVADVNSETSLPVYMGKRNTQPKA